MIAPWQRYEKKANAKISSISAMDAAKPTTAESGSLGWRLIFP
jgi:hypothetical protein